MTATRSARSTTPAASGIAALAVLRRVMRTPTGCFAVCVLALVALTALVSLFWLPQDPNAASAERLWLAPSSAHWLGTDGSGRDIASRLIAGSRVSLPSRGRG